ncbi:MAG: hypothetical protein EB125_10730, partial [Betaproteobacteria bacterium]|nr:hypothetical protein [Betaproteobacteria bacterium]
TQNITLASAIQINGPVTVDAGQVSFGSTLESTKANADITIRAKTNIINSALTTLTTAGGHILLASNVDDATDNDTTTNGYIRLSSGLLATSNGGNITLGGGNLTGTSYAMGSSNAAYTEGIRIDGRTNITSGGGNISMQGKSYAAAVAGGTGASGLGFYHFTQGGVIDSGTGQIYLEGYSQTWGSGYSSGFVLYNVPSFTIKSANTTADAIQIIGTATGTSSGQAWGLESEINAFAVLATGLGGGITIKTSQQRSGDNYDAVFRGTTDILAKSGPINLLGRQSSGIADGVWFISGAFNLGSKLGSADVATSSSDITIKFDNYNFSGLNPSFATTGKIVWAPTDQTGRFSQTALPSWFAWNQNSQTASGITIGSVANTAGIGIDRALSANGNIQLLGGDITIYQNLTATGGNIVLDADTGTTLAKSTHGINLAAGVVLRTITSGDITFYGRSGNSGNSIHGIYAGAGATL